jgi:predicted TIM-barrel fold metal-dependent hydrolase
MNTEKAARFIKEAGTLYEDIVFGFFDIKKYERMAREYKDVDCFGILREMHALTTVSMDGRSWRRIRARIDAKALRFQAQCERVSVNGI